MKAKLETILRDCGKALLKLNLNQRSQGQWEGSQFKAGADNLAHQFLKSELSKKFSLPIVSEEDSDSLSNQSADYLLIDPIDGTASYAHGFKGWVSQIAVISNQVPVAGAILAPETGEFYFAELGKGATLNNCPIKVLTGSQQKIDSIIDNYPTPTGITKELVEHFSIPNYIESGSIGLKICKVASGTSQLFFKNMNPKDWDLAAPQVVINEAGGSLLDLSLQPFNYGRSGRSHDGIIASCDPAISTLVSNWYKSINS
tara:strand:- start:18374 stop:19147 length:774 start_codon:yes stop_codon:yes gene_type:complete